VTHIKPPDPKTATEGPWNSLERTKLAVDVAKTLASLLVSAAIFYIGQQYNKQSQEETGRRQESARQEALDRERLSQVTRKRVELWDKITGDLNDVYSYFLYVGQWKDLSERDIIARKRRLDRTVYSYRPFFTDAFFGAYRDFMTAAFLETSGQWASDARLRTIPIRPQDRSVGVSRFTGQDNGAEIDRKYFELLRLAAREMDIVIASAEKSRRTPASRAELEGSGERVLESVILTLLTRSDDKDSNTRVNADLIDRDGKTIASVVSVGRVFSDNGEETLKLPVSDSISSAAAEEGRLRIIIAPNGNDTWRFEGRLTLRFRDGTILTRTLPISTLTAQVTGLEVPLRKQR
jgi:hypothetical protein